MIGTGGNAGRFRAERVDLGVVHRVGARDEQEQRKKPD
jgi:hypothetical protein